MAEPDSALKVIDVNGNVKFKAPDVVYRALPFVRGLAIYSDIMGNHGLIDKEGNQQLLGTRVSFICDYNKKMTVVGRPSMLQFLVSTPEGCPAYISHYDSFGLVPDNDDLLIVGKDGDWGLIEGISGDILINPHFKGLWPDGSLFVYENEKEKKGWCDKHGEPVIAAKFESVSIGFSEGKYAVVSTSGRRFGVIDREGKYVVSPKYEVIRPAGNDKFFVKAEAGWGIVNAEGEFTAQPQFRNVTANGKVMLATTDDEYWGVIDDKGRFVDKMVYQSPTLSSQMFMAPAEARRVSVDGVVDALKNGLSQFSFSRRLGFLIDLYDVSTSYLNTVDKYLSLKYDEIPGGGMTINQTAEFDAPVAVKKSSGWRRRSRIEPNNDITPERFSVTVAMPLDRPDDTKKIVEKLIKSGFEAEKDEEWNDTGNVIIVCIDKQEKKTIKLYKDEMECYWDEFDEN